VLYGAWRTSFFTKPLQFAPLEQEDGERSPKVQDSGTQNPKPE
jgi:hypothetical protein